MPNVRKSAPPPVSEATVSRIVNAVLRSPRIDGAMVALGISPASVRKSALSKLRKAGVIAGLSKRATSSRVRALEAKLAAETSPVEAVAIRRALAFAKLEGDAK